MAADDPGTWGLVAWALIAWGAYYTVGFFVHFFRFRRLEREVEQGGPDAVFAYNEALRGFPASGYAKMLGKRALKAGADDSGDA